MKQSQRSPRVRIPILHKGTLMKLGYALDRPTDSRRKALAQAVKKYGYSSIVKKVNLLYIYNKRRHPSIAKKASKDKKWLMENCWNMSKVSRRNKDGHVQTRCSGKPSRSRRTRKTRLIRKSRRSRRTRKTRLIRKSRRSRRTRKVI